MTLVAGIDPGSNGAVAVYCTDMKRLVSVIDLPFWYESVGKKKRKRLDPIAMMDLFETLCLMGVQLLVLEAVGGRPQQSASAGFVFGYTVGLIYMAILYNKIMVETVPPTQWKKILRVPGKRGDKERRKEDAKAAKKEAHGDIIKRVMELFPHDTATFKGPQGGYKMDRADAALLAKFAGDHVWPTMSPLTSDVERQLAYRKAETGA
jgi:hypothetical protein